MIYKGDALGYIEETPSVLRDILCRAEDITADAVRVLEGRPASEIYLIGCGSSYHAAYMVEQDLRHLLGIRVRAARPGEFADLEDTMDDRAVVLGISQQGTSVGVIRALDRMRERGVTTIAVTGEHDTEITAHADATLYVECGEEDAGATTKGFTATAFTLLLLFHILRERTNHVEEAERRAFRDAMLALIQEMEQAARCCGEWCGAYADQLASSHDLILIAEGDWNALREELVLKFSETCRFPVRGYDAEEFMHGCYNAVNEDTDILLLGNPAEGMAGRLYRYYAARNRVLCVTGDWGSLRDAGHVMGQEDTAAEAQLRMMGQEGTAAEAQLRVMGQEDNAAEAQFCVWSSILPLQRLFVMTSRKRGIDLNVPRDPAFHIIMGSKLEETDER